jgi:hypothetical protein
MVELYASFLQAAGRSNHQVCLQIHPSSKMLPIVGSGYFQLLDYENLKTTISYKIGLIWEKLTPKDLNLLGNIVNL